MKRVDGFELALLSGIALCFVSGTWAVVSLTVDRWRSRRRFQIDLETRRRVSAALAPTQEVWR